MGFTIQHEKGNYKYFFTFLRRAEGELIEDKYEISKEAFSYLNEMIDKGEKYDDMKYIINGLKADVSKHHDALLRLEEKEDQ